MSKLDELIAELCPDGVRYIEIGNVVNYEQPSKYIVNSTDYDEAHSTPVLTAGQSFILGYTNEIDNIYIASKDNPVIIFDDFTGAFKWVDFPFKVKSSAMKMLTASPDKVLLKFIYHIMGNIGINSNDHKRLWISTYSTFKIPLPPLAVQEEIVRILDTYMDLTAELSAELSKELSARKRQYEFYRNELFVFNSLTSNVRLGDICKVITKGTTPKKFLSTGVAFVKTEAFDGSLINPYKLSFVDEETHFGLLRRSILEADDILITIAGATIGKCALVPATILPANTNQALAIIRLKDGISKSYVIHLLQSKHMKEYILRNVKGSAQPNLNLQQLNDFIVPLPLHEEQERIVRTLARFDTFCNDITSGLTAEIKARRKQFDYYRDKLLTFKEAK